MIILLLLVIYIAFISIGLPDSLFGVSWPLMYLEFGLDISFAPVITIIIAVCTAGVSFLAGPIIRKIGTNWVVACSVLLTALGMLTISLSKHVALIIFGAVMLGIGAGTIDAALNDFVSNYYGPRHMSWLHGFWGVGVTISPLVMAVFLEKGGWRGGYAMMSYVQFGLTAIMFLAIPLWKKVQKLKEEKSSGQEKSNTSGSGELSQANESPSDEESKRPESTFNSDTSAVAGKHIDYIRLEIQEVENVAVRGKEIEVENVAVRGKEIEPLEDIEVPEDGKKKKFNIFKEKGVILAALSFALYCGIEYSCGLWGASFLIKRHDFTPATAARYVSLYYGGIMVGRFIIGIFAGKVPSRIMIRLGIILASMGAILLALPFVSVMLPAMLLIGLGLSPFFPLSIDLTKTRFNPAYSPDIIGVQMGSAYVGAFTVQFAVGYAASKIAWAIYPYTLVAISILLLIVFEGVNIKTKYRYGAKTG